MQGLGLPRAEMTPLGSNGFWHQGRRNFIRELKKQESEQVSRLEVQLRVADDQEAKAELQSQKAKLREDFEGKRKAVDTRLFFG